MWRAIVVVAVLGAFGCRDLSYKEPGAQNAGPRVSVVDPRPGSVLPLRYRVEVNADDPDGVDTVELSCTPGEGGQVRALYAWTAAPYVGEVDLAPCAEGWDGTRETVALLLRARATDRQGGQTSVDVAVEVSPRAPGVTVAAPQRAAPLSHVQVTVTTDRPIAGLPSVLADGIPATVTATSDTTFTASFITPGVGLDVTAPGDPATLEVLERELNLQVSATGTNGNRADVARTLVVSRVLWEREVPGRIATDGGFNQPAPLQPYGYDNGVVLPLEPEGFGSNAYAKMSADDGQTTLYPMPPGSVPRAFTFNGSAVVDDTNGINTLLIAADGTPVAQTTAFPKESPPLAVGQGACVETRTYATGQDECTGLPSMSWRCIGPGLPPNTTAISATSVSGGRAQMFARSGANLLGVNLAECTNLDVANGLWFQGNNTKLNGSGVTGRVQKLLPMGDTGDFVAIAGNASGSVVALQLLAAGGGGTYNLGSKLTADDVIGVRQNGEVLMLAGAGIGESALSAYDLSGTAAATATFPGAMNYAPNPARRETQSNAVIYPDGRVAVLVRTHDYGRAVIATDASLQPRWIYRYPRWTRNATLVADSPGSLLYLVDPDNQRVVALSNSW